MSRATQANLAKEKGNTAFRKEEYAIAHEQYTFAMSLDPSDIAYPLNRSMANLKLKRWQEAEDDATIALGLAPGSVKAYYRRFHARLQLHNVSGAQRDIIGFLEAGGEIQKSKEMIRDLAAMENSLISGAGAPEVSAATNTESVTQGNTSPNPLGFGVWEAGKRGQGAFANDGYQRGDLIVAERPLYRVSHSSTAAVHSAISKLSEAELKQYKSLRNSFSQDPTLSRDPLLGIHQTNAIDTQDGIVLCLAISRFNHSCSPNARYSWHAGSGRQRVYALREIQAEEEIFVSYIGGRNVYGSSRKDRQKRLQRYGFTCACAVCTLPRQESAASDTRRIEVAKIWERIPFYGPSQTSLRLHAIVRALRLLEEEGYAADADDFTNDAAKICSAHGDWASVRYWAAKTYESRVAEFGEDSFRAIEVRDNVDEFRNSADANSLRAQKFSIRL
ncbi:SET domain-containing protein [Leucogyrophana mollusca]|uniref:SET domain-containing protein n=1 Tax=Leucogyrophana mollusca TaxID=85980 RepID=A0ACB8BVJ3_9AGAM|nr:SET domain-containing protein [Leucogyrophana mollusca]